MAIGVSRKMVRQHCPSSQLSKEHSSTSSSASRTKSKSGEYLSAIDGGGKESTSSVLTSDAWMQSATQAVLSLLHALFLLACSLFIPSGNHVSPHKHSAIPEMIVSSRDVLAGRSPEELLLFKQLADGHYIRAKAFLAASRPYLARKVCYRDALINLEFKHYALISHC